MFKFLKVSTLFNTVLSENCSMYTSIFDIKPKSTHFNILELIWLIVHSTNAMCKTLTVVLIRLKLSLIS